MHLYELPSSITISTNNNHHIKLNYDNNSNVKKKNAVLIIFLVDIKLYYNDMINIRLIKILNFEYCFFCSVILDHWNKKTLNSNQIEVMIFQLICHDLCNSN